MSPAPLVLLLAVTALARAQEAAPAVETPLPPAVQRILDGHASERAKEAERYREAIEALKAATIRRLERELRRAEGPLAEAITARIAAIAEEGAVDIFGQPIRPPPPPRDLLAEIRAGTPFRKAGVDERYTITGDRILHSSGLRGQVVAGPTALEITWQNGLVIVIESAADGSLTLHRPATGERLPVELIEE